MSCWLTASITERTCTGPADEVSTEGMGSNWENDRL